MDNEKNSVLEFLNGTSEAKEIFKEEKEEVAETEEQEEKQLPFHKDPKLQKYVDKQIEKALKNNKPSAEQQFKQDTQDINLPPSFVKLIGNDTAEKVEVLKDMSKYFGTLKGEAKQEFLKEMQEQQEKATAADRKAQEDLDNYFEEIEETYDVDLSSKSASAKKMRSDFVDFVRKIAPKNEEGEVTGFPDLVASFEEFQERNKRSSQPSRAKELASRGLTRSTETSAAIPTGRSWKDVDRYFDKLKQTLN